MVGHLHDAFWNAEALRVSQLRADEVVGADAMTEPESSLDPEPGRQSLPPTVGQ
jgi:hypothetical protein